MGTARRGAKPSAGLYCCTMNGLEPPDKHYLLAALGWLELGNVEEARTELERLAPDYRAHPDALEVRWGIQAQMKDWDQAVQTARDLVRVAPDRSSGWLHLAYATRRVSSGGLLAAWEILEPAAEKFPTEPTVAYNLACYACQLKRLEEARNWLRRAFRLGEKKALVQMALKDDDLAPLWSELRRF